jgi:hypothetical protein
LFKCLRAASFLASRLTSSLRMLSGISGLCVAARTNVYTRRRQAVVFIFKPSLSVARSLMLRADFSRV